MLTFDFLLSSLASWLWRLTQLILTLTVDFLSQKVDTTSCWLFCHRKLTLDLLLTFLSQKVDTRPLVNFLVTKSRHNLLSTFLSQKVDTRSLVDFVLLDTTDDVDCGLTRASHRGPPLLPLPVSLTTTSKLKFQPANPSSIDQSLSSNWSLIISTAKRCS